jgi:hypothetical protein
MNEKQWGLVLISPMIIATAVLLMRQGALGLKGVVAVAVATLTVATFLFVNQ